MSSRRTFLTDAGTLAAGALGATALSAAEEKPQLSSTKTVGLCGQWRFRTDPTAAGAEQHWREADYSVNDWQSVVVPHTWQVALASVDYRGIAWYRRTFDVPAAWQQSAVRIEFEAVFHTATVWVNGRLAGEHARKGYTAFALDITPFLSWGQRNVVAVRVDNAFDEHMVPKGRSSDWAHDGGIYRPVQLIITANTFVERVDVEAVPDLASGDGKLAITAYLRNTSSKSWIGRASFRIIDDETGLTVVTGSA